MEFFIDIEVYKEYGEDHYAQAKYLAHGYDDVMWTNDIDQALRFLRSQIMEHI